MLGQVCLVPAASNLVYMNTVLYSPAKVNRKKMVQSPQATALLNEILSKHPCKHDSMTSGCVLDES